MVAVEKKAALFHPSGTILVKSTSADLLDPRMLSREVVLHPSASPPGNFTPTLSSLRI
jgi:hypothetical protein